MPKRRPTPIVTGFDAVERTPNVVTPDVDVAADAVDGGGDARKDRKKYRNRYLLFCDVNRFR